MATNDDSIPVIVVVVAVAIIPNGDDKEVTTLAHENSSSALVQPSDSRTTLPKKQTPLIILSMTMTATTT